MRFVPYVIVIFVFLKAIKIVASMALNARENDSAKSATPFRAKSGGRVCALRVIRLCLRVLEGTLEVNSNTSTNGLQSTLWHQ